jgi:ankyrin repeat protein
LISYGADVNAQDLARKNPIFYAIRNGDLNITRLLLTNKANVKDNPELLHMAVWKECREIIEDLLQYGADVNISDECGRTALHITALWEDGKYFGYWCRKNSDINVKGEIAKLLLSLGANVNAQSKDGITTLHIAAKNGYVKVIEALMQYNADVNCRVNTDVLPRPIAAQKAQPELADTHSNFGTGIDSKDEDGRTPLHMAAQTGHLQVVEILLKFSVSVDSQDECGRTALHLACKEGHEQIVIALLEHGSDINIVSKNNETPLDFVRMPSGPVADILKCHMVKMKTAELFLSGKNLQSISNNDEISDFQNKCEEEMANMKSEKVGNAAVSFYDILTKGVSQSTMYAGNESVVQILRSDDYKVKFPVYASMINCNFRKGERRRELLEQGYKIFHSFSNNFPVLPHECTAEIFSYLSDEDLRILIAACKPVTCQQS